MKIVFCDNSLRELINFREDVINSYAEEGVLVYLIAPRNREYIPKSDNIKIIDINVSRSGMNPINDLKYLLSLLKLYYNLKPDIVFHYTVKPNIYGSIASKLLRIPSVCMIAGLGYLYSNNNFKSRIGRQLYKFAMKFPKKIFVLNEFNKELLISRKLVRPNQLILLKGGEGVNLKKFI